LGNKFDVGLGRHFVISHHREGRQVPIQQAPHGQPQGSPAQQHGRVAFILRADVALL
jgi:hypothetical protein